MIYKDINVCFICNFISKEMYKLFPPTSIVLFQLFLLWTLTINNATFKVGDNSWNRSWK